MPSTPIVSSRHALAAALVSLGATLLGGCAPSGVITNDVIEAGPLLAATTFGAGSSDPIDTSGPVRPEVPGVIAEAVIAELESRGYRIAEDADLLGRAFARVNEETITLLAPPTRALGPVTTETATIREGSLVIEFFDAASGELVWRSEASGVIRRPASDDEIREAIAAMFDGWPAR